MFVSLEKMPLLNSLAFGLVILVSFFPRSELNRSQLNVSLSSSVVSGSGGHGSSNGTHHRRPSSTSKVATSPGDASFDSDQPSLTATPGGSLILFFCTYFGSASACFFSISISRVEKKETYSFKELRHFLFLLDKRRKNCFVSFFFSRI